MQCSKARSTPGASTPAPSTAFGAMTYRPSSVPAGEGPVRRWRRRPPDRHRARDLGHSPHGAAPPATGSAAGTRAGARSPRLAPRLLGRAGALPAVRADAPGLPVGPDRRAFGTMTQRRVRYQRAKGCSSWTESSVGRATSLGIWGTATRGGRGTSGAARHRRACRRGPPGRRRQLVGQPSRRRPARLRRRALDVRAMDMPAGSGATACGLASRRSGDGTTPGGVFPLASMTAPDGRRSSSSATASTLACAARGARSSRRLLGRDAQHRGLQPARHPHGGKLPEPGRVPRQLPGSYSRAAIIGANMGPTARATPPASRRWRRRSSSTVTRTTPPATAADVGLVSLEQRQPDLRPAAAGSRAGLLRSAGPNPAEFRVRGLRWVVMVWSSYGGVDT